MMKKIIFPVALCITYLTLSGCSPMCLLTYTESYGCSGSGRDYISLGKLFKVHKQKIVLFTSKAPEKDDKHDSWMREYSRESKHDGYAEGYAIDSEDINLAWGFYPRFNKYGNTAPQSSALYRTTEQYRSDLHANFRDAQLDEYLSALQGKQTLAQAHSAYFKAFYPDSKILAQTQRNVKGVQCMQTKAEYKKAFLVELQCPVFFRNTFGTITYLMNTTRGGRTKKDFEVHKGDYEYYKKEYGEAYAQWRINNKNYMYERINTADDYLESFMPTFNHMVDTLEFIEPVSQTVPAGFSLDEQFKRMQDPKWKL